MNTVEIQDTLPTNTNVLIPPALAQKETLSAKKIAQLSATHYGWVPYDDIELMGPLGLERRVVLQANGDFATRLSRSQLLIFQNVAIRQLHENDNNIPNGPKPFFEEVPKYAGTCASEIEDAYGEWGFMTLWPLIGMTPQEAFRIFSVVQPLAFDLADLEVELGDKAITRIADALAKDETFPDATAEELRRIMVIGARRGVIYASNIVDTLRTEMADRQGGGHGRSYASPGDAHAFRQLHQPVPSRLALANPPGDNDIRALLKALAEKQLRGEEPNAQEAQFALALELMKKSEERQNRLEEELRGMREAEAQRNAAATG